ncbi:MAG: aminoacyl-tRNA hydrolase [Bacteroidota bacterium]
MKFLVVGLGNPGAEYDGTRHNIGFAVVDLLAESAGVSFSSERLGSIARIKIRGKQVTLLKPNTYMNLSGKAVNYWLQHEQIPVANMIVVTDDLALPVGSIRIRLKGSDGGHNGLKSINETLNSTDYPRLRFGIGSQFSKGKQADYVLSVWTDEENNLVKEKTKRSAEAITHYISAGPVFAMNQFND